MRRLLLLALLLPILAPALHAQPAISYIIPDIGTPGMNTYVEIIAPVARTNSFGNGRGLVASTVAFVELVNAADSARVLVSPCVVSWNGRMISCQFFVRPGAALTPSGVPFRINVGGTRSNVDTFFIVAPQVLGNNGSISGGGQLGSGTYGSGLGRRSKRGAMIVESLTLSSGTYGVSVVDTINDNNPGNQGYLPFVLLSRGPIAIASDASINVNARGKHGGPGGGGGGGYGTDRTNFPPIPGEEDAPQGDGFAGGKRTTTLPSNSDGIGTGALSASLNGVTANTVFNTAGFSIRLFGSGPGHPFDLDGRSGGAALAAAAPPAFFGTYFGGGGNATPGTGITGANTDVNGQPMGSAPIVPLHGGGGGSSGGSNDSIGGGGGGGMAIYSQRSISISTAEARGANGRSGCGTCGTGSGDGSAGGAGGSIITGGRLGIAVQTVTLTGGTAGANAGTSTAVVGGGGVGRYRHDGRYTGVSPTLATGATSYTGPSLDTISYANNTIWTVTGTGRPGADIEIYLRGENSTWIATPYTATVATSDSTWSRQVVFPYDSIAYIFVLQKTPTAERNATYDSVPHQIFSQIGASVVRLDIAPVIDAPAEIQLENVICPADRTGRFRVYNRGTAPLILLPATRFIGANASLFAVITPQLPDTIYPDAFTTVTVTFNGVAAANGDRTGTLRIASNDPRNPFRDVTIRVAKESRIFTAPPRVIDLGDVRVGTTRDSISGYVNRNSYADTLTFAARDSGSALIRLLSPSSTPVYQPAGATLPLRFSFTPTDTGRFTARFRIRLAPCGVDTVVTVTGYARSPIIHSVEPSYMFVGLACSDTASRDIVIFNGGNAPLVLDYPVVRGADRDSFAIISPDPASFPRTLQVGERMTFTVRGRSTVRRPLSAFLDFTSNDALAGKNPFPVALESDPAQVELTPSATTIDFGTLCLGDSRTLPLTLSTITSSITINLERIDRADSSTPFVFVSQWFYPFPVSVGRPGSQTMELRFAPTKVGRFSDTLYILSSPCDKLITVVLTGTAVSSELVADRADFQFGDVPVGTRPRQTVKLRNPATALAPLVIRRLVIAGAADPQITIVSPTFPPTITLDPGEEIDVVVEYAPSVAARLPALRLCVDVTDPCPASSFCLAIDGNGIISSVAASRSSLSMTSAACAAPTSVEDTLTVTNIGTVPLDVTSITVTPAPTFTLISPTTAFTLAPGTSRRITVGYLPGVPSTIASTGTLTVTTTDPDRPSFTIPLSGRRDTALFGLDRSAIDFRTTASCAAPMRDSFVVRNSGTVEDTIRVISSDGAVLLPPPPYNLAPGRDTTVVVTIAPSAEGPWRSVIRLGSAPCALEDSVVLAGNRYTPTYTIGAVDFGEVPIGGSATASATITNPNPEPVRITGATIVPASGDVSLVPGQFPILIGAGGSAPVSLRYSPTAAGVLPPGIMLTVAVDTVCPATLESAVTGSAVRGGLLVEDLPDDLGSTLGCLIVRDTIVIRNSGTSPVMITGAAPIGPPIPGFQLQTSPLPHTILPGQTDTLWPTYVATLGTPGVHIQNFRITTTDPDRPTIDFTIRVDHIYESLALDGPAFASTMPGATSRATRTLTNNGTAPVTIRSLAISPPFSIVSVTPNIAVPFTLLPGEVITIEVEFAPLDAGEFTSSLGLAPVLTCNGFPEYPITARAAGTIAAAAQWGTASGRPGDRVLIPLALASDLGDADVRSYTLAVGFNPTMLRPIGLRLEGTLSTGWMVTSSNLRAGEARFDVSGPNAIEGPGVVAYLEAVVTLGDSLTTTIRSLDGTATTSGRALLAVAPGLFTLEGYCDIGGARLVRVDGAFALRSIRPNPASGRAEVDIELIESGRTRLRILDILGREVAILLDGALETRIHTVAIDLGRIAAGVYYLELQTPTGRLVRELVVTK